MIHIVLVKPEIPQNTGNIVRTAAATGSVVHLVRPLGFDTSDRMLRRAGLDYWKDCRIEYHDSFGEVLAQYRDKEFWYFSTKAQRVHTEPRFSDEVFLVFGKETKGLPEQLIYDHYEHALRIPMIADTRSLNLSNSVAIAVYEVLRQQGFAGFNLKGSLREF